jgi:hypothetical protein
MPRSFHCLEAGEYNFYRDLEGYRWRSSDERQSTILTNSRHDRDVTPYIRLGSTPKAIRRYCDERPSDEF